MNAFCSAGKKALLDAVVRHQWRAALYTSRARLNAISSAYTPDNEVPNGDGYTRGGAPLTGATTGSADGTAWLDFADITWPRASFSARYMLIFDASDQNRAYALIDFGEDKKGQGGDFTFQFPPPTSLEAIIGL